MARHGGKRVRVAVGIFRDAHGFAILWSSGGARHEARLPLDTPVHRLKQYRAEQLETAAPAPKAADRHGLARDVVRFLRWRKDRPGYKAARSHLRAWVHRFPRKSRWSITADDAQRAVADWQHAELSAQTIAHRVKLLRQVYQTLDGADVRTPLDGLDLPPLPRSRPASVPDDLVLAVAIRLQHQELNDGRMASAKTRARYLVLATTGQRPAQVMRAKPEDVDLSRRLWFVRSAKGDRGALVALNDDMVAAWTLFAQSNAWGPYSSRSFAGTLRRAGWPVGIRPYNLRHTVGMSLSDAGVQLGDISAHMGHSSMDVTRRFYVPAEIARLRAASAALDGRMTAGTTPHVASTSKEEAKREQREMRRKSKASNVEEGRGAAPAKRAKTA